MTPSPSAFLAPAALPLAARASPFLCPAALPRAAPASASSPARASSVPISMAGGVPKVPYKGKGAQNYEFIDVFQRLNRDRIIFVGQDIDDELANQICATLLYLQQEDDKAPVTMYFNCPGGGIEAVLMIMDTMNAMSYPIGTLNLGLAASMAGFLCGAGTKGRRMSLPNARFMLQNPSLYEAKMGQAADIEIEVVHVLQQRELLLKRLSEFTGRSVDVIRKDLKRDLYLTAFEAREYGLIDQVLTPKPSGARNYGPGSTTKAQKNNTPAGIY